MRFALRSRLAAGLGLAFLAVLAVGAAADRPVAGPEAASDPVSTASEGARCVGSAYDDTVAFQAALDTGRTVYAPALGGHCHVTRPLVMRTPGQIIHGDGRARTRIVIEPSFAGAGVFVAATGEPGPVWRDLSVTFVQPDVADRAKLVRYPPAFLARATPRFEIEHVGCYTATTCIDMTGNSGGATVSDFQMSAFETGIDIDGSLDTVRIVDPHWWPFGMSPKQQSIFASEKSDRAIALRLGRVDDLVIRGGVFLGGLALYSYTSDAGTMFGTITDVDFDSLSGIVMEAGSLQISSAIFTLGDPRAQAIYQTGGRITIASTVLSVGAKIVNPAVTLSGGSLTIADSQITTGGFDSTAIAQLGTGGSLTLDGNFFDRQPNQAYTAPTIILQAGRTTAIGNRAADKGSKGGIFMQVGNDNPFNRVMGNASPGWPAYAPPTRRGIYLFN